MSETAQWRWHHCRWGPVTGARVLDEEGDLMFIVVCCPHMHYYCVANAPLLQYEAARDKLSKDVEFLRLTKEQLKTLFDVYKDDHPLIAAACDVVVKDVLTAKQEEHRCT